MRLQPGVFGRFYETGKRSIQIAFTFRGVQCRETMTGLDPTKKNHEKFAANTLASIQRDIDLNNFNYLDYFPESKRARLFGFVVSKRTVKQIGKSWLDDMERSLPHSTYRSYRGPCDRFIFPAIGDLRAGDVTPEHIRRMFREANFCLKTARNYAIPLRAIFDRAIDDDDIERHPMSRIKIKTLIPKDRHKTDYEVDPLDEREIRAVLEACKHHRPDWLNYFTLAFYTGLRTSEQFGLEWSDVNWADRSIDIQRAVVEGQPKGPKTRASKRMVSLCDLAWLALKRQRPKTELKGAPVFRHPVSGYPLSDYESTEAVFDYCLKRAGVRRRTQYHTRHTYASNLLSQGENPLYVAKQLGHKNVQMVFKVYGKWIGSDAGSNVTFGRVADPDPEK